MPDVEVAGAERAGASAGPTGSSRLAAEVELANGRYRIGAFIRRATVGEIYRATDTTTSHPVGIYLLDAQRVAQPDAVEALRHALARVAAVRHKNLLAIGELGVEGAHAFIVTEYVDGGPLTELMARKQQAGGVFSPKGAYNVMAHLCNALSELHAAGISHGMLHPGNVLVNRAGRVKLAELGLGELVDVGATAAAGYAAPEVLQARQLSPAADVYAAGAILYHLLTGAPPRPGAPPPSKVTLGLPAAIDQLVGCAVAPSPERRFAEAQQLKQALARVLDGPTAAAPAANAAAPVAKRPSLAQQLSSDQQTQLRATAPPPTSAADALSDTREKWLVHRDRLDYGPFTLAQVVEQINANEILPGNLIIDNDTGERIPIDEHPLLGDLVEQARQRRDDQRRAHAEVAHAQSEKRRGAALYGFIAAGVLALGAGVFFLVGALSSAGTEGESASLSALEEAKLEATIRFPTPAEKTTRGKARRGGKRRGGSGGAMGGFDDPLDLGDVSEGAASERLSDSEINPVISRHGGALGRCLTRSGSRSARVEFAIKGSTGKVYAVRVNGQETGALASCIAGAMRKMKFPTFSAPRTRAEFEMSL